MAESLPEENNPKAALEALKARAVKEKTQIEQQDKIIEAKEIKDQKLEVLETGFRELDNQPATPENVKKSLALLDEYESVTGASIHHQQQAADIEVETEAKGTKEDGKKIETLTADGVTEAETGEKITGPRKHLSEMVEKNVQKELLKIAARKFSEQWIKTAPKNLEIGSDVFSKNLSELFKNPDYLLAQPWFATFFDALAVYVDPLKTEKTKPEIDPGRQHLGSVDFSVALKNGVQTVVKAIRVFGNPKYKDDYDINKFSDPQILLTDPDSPLYIKNGFPFHKEFWLNSEDKDFGNQLIEFVDKEQAEADLKKDLDEKKPDEVPSDIGATRQDP